MIAFRGLVTCGTTEEIVFKGVIAQHALAHRRPSLERIPLCIDMHLIRETIPAAFYKPQPLIVFRQTNDEFSSLHC